MRRKKEKVGNIVKNKTIVSNSGIFVLLIIFAFIILPPFIIPWTLAQIIAGFEIENINLTILGCCISLISIFLLDELYIKKRIQIKRMNNTTRKLLFVLMWNTIFTIFFLITTITSFDLPNKNKYENKFISDKCIIYGKEYNNCEYYFNKDNSYVRIYHKDYNKVYMIYHRHHKSVEYHCWDSGPIQKTTYEYKCLIDDKNKHNETYTCDIISFENIGYAKHRKVTTKFSTELKKEK